MNCRHFFTVLFLAATVLTGCAPAPERPSPDREPRLERARELAERGEFSEAAALHLALAGDVADERRDRLLLQAAEWYLADREYGQARAVLERIRRDRLPDGERARFDLAAGEVALGQASPAEALALLPLDAAEVPPDLRMRYHRLRAEALLADGRPFESALERQRLGEWLTGPTPVHDNREALLSALLRLPPEAMERRAEPLATDDPMRGWLALAFQMKTRLFEGEPMEEALSRWRERYPRHPAGEVLADDLVRRYQASFAYPEQVALLLPLSGRFESAATAIRDGFFTAWYQDSRDRPAVRVYDVESHPQGVVGAYRQAVDAGAGWVVGPLERAHVERLMAQPALPVPVLALNYAESQSTQTGIRNLANALPMPELGDDPAGAGRSRVFQFGLLPEQEARQAAERLMADGRRRTLVLAPRDDWGERMMRAFVDEYTGLGGYVTELSRYYPEETDHSDVLRRLLALDASAQRARSLRQVLGQPLEYVPRARDDVDALFLAARPEQARQIRPQLRFFDAGDLPVYGTSHLFAGRSVTGTEIDMEGIIFCDAPWMLGAAQRGPARDSIKHLFPALDGANGRLFAIGADAYRLIPYVDWLTDHPGDEYEGWSGRIWVDEELRLHRRLSWARFRSGVPESLQDARRTGAPR